MATYAQLFLDAVTGQESGGSYTVTGSPVQDSNGNTVTALGRYQFLPGTAASYVPSSFTQQYGKNYLDPNWQKAFLNSPQIQDATAQNYVAALAQTATKKDPSFVLHPETWYLAEGWYGGGGAIGGPDEKGQGPNAPSLYSYADQVQARFVALVKNNYTSSGNLANNAGVNATDQTPGGNGDNAAANSQLTPGQQQDNNIVNHFGLPNIWQANGTGDDQPGDTFILGGNVSALARGIEKNVFIGAVLLAILAGGFALLASSSNTKVVPVPV